MVFISYRREDTKDLALSLRDKLATQFGKGSVFVDRESILAGDDWRYRIEQAIRDSQVVLAMIGPNWLHARDDYGRRRIDDENDVLAYELKTALRLQVLVIPLYVDGTAPLVHQALPGQLKLLADKQGMAFEMLRDFEQLTAILRPHLGSTAKQAFREWLKPLNFQQEKNTHLPNFTGREWVGERLDNWIDRKRLSRVFCLLGGPGIGKSAIACHWCYTRSDIIAFHHCVHGNPDKTDPRRTFFSLAAQVAEHLPEYEQRLAAIDRNEMETIVKGGDRAVFENLLLKPLSGSFPAPDGDRLVVIDGLDEATTGETNELAKVIGEVWVGLPDWLRLVVTARPELDVSEYLSSLHPFVLNASSPENMGDIRMFLRRQLTPDQASDEMLNEIVAKSEGMFLYAHLMLDEIGSDRLTLDRVADFPQGLTGYYKGWFSRKFPDAGEYHEKFHQLVSVIVAQKAPLPLEVLSDAVGQRVYDLLMCMRRLGVVFPLRNEEQGNRSVTYVTLMHKSLYDWLTGRHPATHLPWAGVFASDLELGNHLLAEEGWRVYCKGSLETDTYFREALLDHLAEDKQSDKLAKVLLDTHLVDSLWYKDNRAEWQRHINRLPHGLSLSKLVRDWLAERDSRQRRTVLDAVVAGKLCRLFQEIGAFDEAMALGEAALRIWHENNVQNSPEMVGTYLAIGGIQSKREQLENAAESHEKALEIAQRAYARDSPEMADVLYRLNVFYTSSKRDYKKATECLNKCYAIYQQCSPPNLVGMANCINDRAVIYNREQRSSDELALYREALSLFERATPRGHPEMVSTLSNVAFALLKDNKPSEALPLLRRAVAMAEVVLLPQHEYSENARSLLCTTLMRMAHDDEALEVMRQHVEEHERYPGKNHVDTAYARLVYCSTLWQVVLTAETSVDSPHRHEIRRQCQLIERAKAGTILGLLNFAENAQKASETGLYRCLREAAQRACQSEPEPGVEDDWSGSLPAACYGQIVDLVLSDQPVTKIGPTILGIWQREAPKLEQNADLLPQTRKAITQLIAWYGLLCLDKSDDIDSVREAFDLITQIGADSPETLDHLASLTVTLHHRRLDETSEFLCQDLLERAERILGSDHIQTHTYLENLAFMKMCRNKFEEASNLFQRAVQTHVRQSGHDDFGAISTVVNVAECLLMQDRSDEALQLIRDFADKFPKPEGQTSPRKTLAEVLNAAAMRQKNEFARFEAARACYGLSLEFNPDQAVIHSNFALLLWACLDAYDDADSHFRRSLEIDDRSDNTHSVYGLFLGQTREDFKQAIEHFEKAAELNRYDTGTLNNHASVLLVCGEAHAAWRLAKRAMRLCQPHPDRIMARALFDGAAALMLLGKDPSLPLGQLKTLFARRIDHAPWVITALLKKLENQLPPDSFALVKAVSEAIDNKQQLAQLEQIPAWQSTEARPLDIPWPEI